MRGNGGKRVHWKSGKIENRGEGGRAVWKPSEASHIANWNFDHKKLHKKGNLQEHMPHVISKIQQMKNDHDLKILQVPQKRFKEGVKFHKISINFRKILQNLESHLSANYPCPHSPQDVFKGRPNSFLIKNVP